MVVGRREKGFGKRDVLVRGSGWCVDEEVVRVGRPENVGEELPYHGRLFRAAPYDGRGARGE